MSLGDDRAAIARCLPSPTPSWRCSARTADRLRDEQATSRSDRPLLAGPPQPDHPTLSRLRAGRLDDLAAGTRARSATDEPSCDHRLRSGRASSVGGVAAGPQEQSGRAPPARLRVLGGGRADHHRGSSEKQKRGTQAASGIPLPARPDRGNGRPRASPQRRFRGLRDASARIGFERGRLAWVRWLIGQIEDDPEENNGGPQAPICRLRARMRHAATPDVVRPLPTRVCGGAPRIRTWRIRPVRRPSRRSRRRQGTASRAHSGPAAAASSWTAWPRSARRSRRSGGRARSRRR